MKKLNNTSQRIRVMIDGGHTNKAIIDRLKCKPQAVYNTRYQLNKERGLGSIGTLPKPTVGIGAPPKRKYTRKAKAETGIAYDPAQLQNVHYNPARNAYAYATNQYSWPYPHGTAPEIMTKPTLWQRIKGWFRG